MHKSRVKYNSYSKQLTNQMRFLFARIGMWTTSSKNEIVEGRIVYPLILTNESFNKLNQIKDFPYRLEAIKGPGSFSFIIDDKMIFVQITSVGVEKYKGKVFDLTVENDSSYIANSMLVHNSAAGSLVLFLLGITSVDPIIHDLDFDRFLSADEEYHTCKADFE